MEIQVFHSVFSKHLKYLSLPSGRVIQSKHIKVGIHVHTSLDPELALPKYLAS